MYMPKSATPVGGMPQQSPQNINNGYMPKSATLSQNSQQQNSPSFGGFLGNLLSSTTNTAGNLINTVSHPIQSAENMVKLPFGEGEVAASKLFGNPNKYSDSNMQMANNFNQYMGNRYGGINQIGNTLYNDPIGAALDASSVLDGGESLAGTTANLMGDAGKASMIAKAGNVMGKASDITNPMNALTAPMKLNGKLQQIIGNAVGGAGESLPLRGLRASASQLTNFAKNTGGTLQDFLNKNNITGDFQTAAHDKLSELYPQYENLATQTGLNIPITKVQEAFKPLVDEWSSSTLPALKGKAEDLKGYLAAVEQKHGGNIPIAKILEERQQADSMLRPGQFTTSLTPEQTMLYKNIRDKLKGVIDTATQGQTGSIGKQINQWENLKEIADKQINLGKGSKPISLLGGLFSGGAGAAGATLGGLPGMALGMASGPVIDAINSNPRIISAESKILKGTGKAVSSIGKAQSNFAGSPGMQYLLKLLRTSTSANGNIQTSQQQ